MKYAFKITGNQGYSHDQVQSITVAELMEMLEELEPEDELFLKDTGNRYGANWHSFLGNTWDAIVPIDADEDDED